MKKLLIMCMVLAGAFSFTGYGNPPQKETAQTAITGFGGYVLGSKLNPKQLTEKMREKGYVVCKAKKTFRNFEKIELYFTPKTFLVYKIESRAEGDSKDMAIIKASFEKKYGEKMESAFLEGYRISRGSRTIFIRDRAMGNEIYVTDNKLQKQNDKEKEEIAQEQVDTTGL